MKTKTIIILVVIFLLILIGGTAYFIKKDKDEKEKLKAPDVPNNPEDGLGRDFLSPPAGINNGTIPPPANGTTAAQNVAIINVESAAGKAAIAVKAEIMERTPEANGKIRRRYNLGEKLFENISEAQAEIIKVSFANFITGLDKNNLMEYPLYGTYTKPALMAELKNFVEKYKANGVRLDSKTLKVGSTKIGFLPSIGYNIVTGTDREAVTTEADLSYFRQSNGIQNLTVAGRTIVKFAENWIAEIDRLNDSVKKEAINKCLREGWKFEGYTAPTATDL